MAEEQKHQLKTSLIILQLILAITLVFASCGMLAQQNNPGHAVGTNSLGAGDFLVIQPNNETLVGPIESHRIESVDITLYRFEESTPQPMTYYIDYMEIKNISDNQTACVNIRVENIVGQENLGGITFWLFENQTNTPELEKPIATAKMTNKTADTLSLIDNYLIKPNSTSYIELGGYASIDALEGSKIDFTLVVEPVTQFKSSVSLAGD